MESRLVASVFFLQNVGGRRLKVFRSFTTTCAAGFTNRSIFTHPLNLSCVKPLQIICLCFSFYRSSSIWKFIYLSIYLFIYFFASSYLKSYKKILKYLENRFINGSKCKSDFNAIFFQEARNEISRFLINETITRVETVRKPKPVTT